MKVEKKLEIFKRTALLEAGEKRRVIRRDADEKLRRAVDEAVREAEKTAAKRVRDERYAIEKNRNKQTVAATAAAKRALIELRASLTEALFDGVRADVAAFAQSEAYDGWLCRGIAQAAAGSPGRFSAVRLSPRDMRLAGRIEQETGLTAEPHDTELLGGFLLTDETRRQMADHTLDARLTAERQDFSVYAAADMEVEA